MMALPLVRAKEGLLSLLLVVLLVGGVAWAAQSVSYDLSWWTVDAGGHTFSTGGGYTLGGTIGQPDAGALTGGDYTLGGGFWRGDAVAVRHQLYLPLMLRGH
jgi:hypothetical protein